MNYSAMFKSLCLPSKVYFVLSFVGILISVVSPSTFGHISLLMHFLHLVYIVFWAWILNLICKAGYKWISWVLVLAPFVLMFLMVALLLSGGGDIQMGDERASQQPVIIVSK